MSAKRIKNPNQPIKTRVHNMYGGMIKRHEVKYWKTGRRKGLIRVPAIPIPFTEAELFEWTLNLGPVFRCPYCSTLLTPLVFSVDHEIPLGRGGSLDLANLSAVCKLCNALKGALTGEEYRHLRRSLETLHPDAQKSIYQRLKSGGFRWVKPKEIAA